MSLEGGIDLATIPSPRTWTDGTVVTAALLNQYVRDVQKFILRPPMAKVYKSANQTISSGSTTTLTLDTTMFDTDGIVDGTGGLTIVTPGVYQISCGALYANFTAAASRVFVRIQRTSDSAILASAEANASSGTFPTMTASALVSLAAGDTLKVQTFQNTGASQTLQSSSGPVNFLSAIWLGSL